MAQSNGTNKLREVLIVVNLLVIVGGGAWSITGINQRIHEQELRLQKVEQLTVSHSIRLAVKSEKLEGLEEALKKCERYIMRRDGHRQRN